MRRFACVVAVVALLGLLSGARAHADDTAAAVSPDEWFFRMRDAVAAERLPTYVAYASALDLTYTVESSGTGRQTIREKRRFDLRTYDGVRCALTEDGAPKLRADRAPVYLDEPTMSPLSYARVVSAALPLFTGSAIEAEPDDADGARKSRAYVVTRSGTETIDGTPVEHLVLTPRADPDRHPWRDAWIDPTNDRLVRARIVGTIRIAQAYGTILLRLDVARVANVTTIVRVAAADRIPMGPKGQVVSLAYAETFSDFTAGDAPQAACPAFPPSAVATIVTPAPRPTPTPETLAPPEPPVVVAAAGSRDPSDTPTVTPDERFLRMRDAIAAQRLPSFFAYVSTLRSQYALPGRGRTAVTLQRRIDLRVDDGLRCVARDDGPPAFVFAATMTPLSYARVVSAELPPARNTALPVEPEGPPLAVIGRAAEARTSRYYRITSVAYESIAGTTTQHLKLVPRTDPDAHPWRDAWIDPATDRLVRARVMGSVVVENAAGSIPMLLEFREDAGVTTIARVFASDFVETVRQSSDFFARKALGYEVRLDERFSAFAHGSEPLPSCVPYPAPKASAAAHR